MYRILYGSEVLHDPRDPERILNDAKAELAVNDAGTLTFTMQPTHPMHGLLMPMDKENEVVLEQDGVELFRGRIRRIKEGFYEDQKIECEGELSYLNDVTLRPYTTLDDGVPSAVDALFAWYVLQYNQMTEERYRFTVGTNEAWKLDTNNYLYRANSDRPNVAQEIKEKLLSTLGGYVRTRRAHGLRTIDYLASGDSESSQRIEFGENLLDFTRDRDWADYYTVIVPIGAELEVEGSGEDTEGDSTTYAVMRENAKSASKLFDNREEAEAYAAFLEDKYVVKYYVETRSDDQSEKLTIDGEPDRELTGGLYKQGDRIIDLEAVQRYGYIERVVEFEDITVGENLVNAAARELRNAAVGDVLEINAVDLHMIDPEMDPIYIGDFVRVTSKPHGYDEYFVCSSMTVNVSEPSENTFTLGNEYEYMTAQQASKISMLNSSITQGYDEVKALSADAKAKAEQAEKTSHDVLLQLEDLTGTYVHIRYSANADGSDMTEVPDDTTLYIGICSNENETAPTDAASYTWSRIKGDQGIQGVDGDSGKSSYLHIKYSNDGGTTFTDNEGETVGEYMGTCVNDEAADPMTTTAYTWSKIKGDEGVGVESIYEQYYQSTSYETTTGGSWLSEYPDWVEGMYLWTRNVTKYTDGTSYQTQPICVTGSKGATGDPGASGAMLYGTCGSAAGTSAKAATVDNFPGLVVGTVISVKFTYANTSATPTLNVNASGAKSIVTNGLPSAFWTAGQTVQFVYDGSAWQVLSAAVYAFQATIGNPGGNNVLIDDDSVDIRNGSTANASFSADGVELAKNSDSAYVKMCGGKGTIEYSSDPFTSSKNGLRIYPGVAGNLMDLLDTDGTGVRMISNVGDLANHGAVVASANHVFMGIGDGTDTQAGSGGYLDIKTNQAVLFSKNIGLFGTNLNVNGTSYTLQALQNLLTTGTYKLSDGFVLYRSGNVVSIVNSGNQTHTIAGNWSEKSLGTIPEGWRPPAWMVFQPVTMSGRNIYLQVDASGNCTICNGDSSSYTGQVPVSGTWVIGG